MSVKRLINCLSSKKCQFATRFIKRERENLRMKTSKLITKIQNLVNTDGTNKMEKQIREFKKSKTKKLKIIQAGCLMQ